MIDRQTLRVDDVTLAGAQETAERWSVRLAGLGAAVLLIAGFLMWQREGVAVFADAILNGLGTCF
jgi:hypothetical protein